MNLLQGIMAYPSFNMKLSILPQLLKLEEHFNQYEKLGRKLAPDMKAAVLLKVIGCPLKTHLIFTLNEGSSYQKIREDCACLRYSQHQVERERSTQFYKYEPNDRLTMV